ncbi:transmembrane protein 179-like isoform X2 [Rhincodon typus]|uniref:transmembrane protein 179-like isoform X2 n=1 Tax=Rhincodon typus TaxID=259920 RepID=UPI002030F2BB|nr:transmembrane protein 179-like isoform X2 [Rhincodon typus]
MGISNRLLFCQCTAYLLAFVLALFAAVPLGQDQHELRGRCPLYGVGSWRRSNESGATGCAQTYCFHVLRWGPPSACRYSLFMGIFSCAYSALQGFRSTYHLCNGFEDCRDAQEESLNLSAVPTLFYDHFGTAQFGLWCAWIVWIALAILAFLKVSHSRSKVDFTVQYKETLLSQQSQRYFRGEMGNVFI